ncbi:hypothetical protein BCR35DRAFT_329881 [Leucosporidium creatinivorum]|uniref:F-box domain-containing protein n=1 Tax=Leucosporidium creatinivorum TaxID=106004 RepID=A0A1Y2G148_9BASI|nr:hypothetical protein BCR35DRAFT_329881 [Leucosporidium creatinivorum]
MPVPAIPPEIVEEILEQLTWGRTAHRDLLACSLVSRTFNVLSRADSIWKPITRRPVYVELSNEEDQRDMELAFPLERRDKPTIWESLLAWPKIIEIAYRHFDALLAEPTNKILHVLALVELGDQNLAFLIDSLALQKVEELKEKFPADWMARRYWARQVRGVSSRREAVEIWKRIGDGWEGSEAFYEGIFAFGALYGKQELDAADWPLEYIGPHFRDAVQDTLEGEVPLCHLGHFMEKGSFCGTLNLDPAGEVISNILLDGHPPKPDELFVEGVIDMLCKSAETSAAAGLGDDEDEEKTNAAQMVLAALLCASNTRYTDSRLVLYPVQVPHVTFLAAAFKSEDGRSLQAEDIVYLSFAPAGHAHHDMIEKIYFEDASDLFRRNVDLARFLRPTSTRDLIHSFASDVTQAFIVQHEASNSNQWFSDSATGRYGASFAALLVPRSNRVIGMYQNHFDIDYHIDTIAYGVDVAHPWDAEWIRQEVFSRLNPNAHAATLLPHLERWDCAKEEDAIPEITRSRTARGPAPKFRIGDIVRLEDGEKGVIIAWDSSSFFGVAASGQISEANAEKRKASFFYTLLNLEGALINVLDRDVEDELEPYTATQAELNAFESCYDLGKYCKRLDKTEERRRFVIADDHAKLYPNH